MDKINNTQKRQPKNDIKFTIQLSQEQKEAKSNILNHAFSFVEGHVGSGKTLVACQIALDLLFKRTVDKVVITRPTVGTEDNGFLPGSFEEKMEPWIVPIKDNMRKVYNFPQKLEKLYKDGEVELVSLSHFRGRTFENAVCIVDEFQNLSKQQLQMALGRLGKGSIMIFCGDARQIDLKHNNDSAIHEVAKIEKSKYVYRVRLTENHRHEAVDEVLNILYGYH